MSYRFGPGESTAATRIALPTMDEEAVLKMVRGVSYDRDYYNSVNQVLMGLERISERIYTGPRGEKIEVKPNTVLATVMFSPTHIDTLSRMPRTSFRDVLHGEDKPRLFGYKLVDGEWIWRLSEPLSFEENSLVLAAREHRLPRIPAIAVKRFVPAEGWIVAVAEVRDRFGEIIGKRRVEAYRSADQEEGKPARHINFGVIPAHHDTGVRELLRLATGR